MGLVMSQEPFDLSSCRAGSSMLAQAEAFWGSSRDALCALWPLLKFEYMAFPGGLPKEFDPLRTFTFFA